MTKQRILVVEDEESVRLGLIDLLTYHGYDVTSTDDGEKGCQLALSKAFDLVIVDIGLPRRDGFSICRIVRSKDEEVGLIALTARTEEADIVRGFCEGVDDYVCKPFSIHQLMHRIRAVLRRRSIGSSKLTLAEFTLGDFIRIKPASLRGELLDDASRSSVVLSKREIDILSYLFDNGHRVVPRSELLTRLWRHRPGSAVATRTVDIHIAKLRKKIEPNPAEPRFLITLRSEGYQLVSARSTGQC